MTDIDDLKLRPIIAGPSSLPHRLSNLLNIPLRPFTKHVDRNLRDTTDFLNNLSKEVQPNTLLASFDIEALYCNIPHDLGIGAVKYWLEKYPEELKRGFQKHSKAFCGDSYCFMSWCLNMFVLLAPYVCYHIFS